MIDLGQFVNGLWMGLILILLGLFPGAMQRAAETMASISTLSRLPGFSHLRAPTNAWTIRAPRWLALLGIAIILLTTLAYVAR